MLSIRSKRPLMIARHLSICPSRHYPRQSRQAPTRRPIDSHLPPLVERETSSAAPDDARPWYLDEIDQTPAPAAVSPAAPPRYSPQDLPPEMFQLYQDLTNEANLEPASIAILDAQAATDDGVTWCDWIVVCSLRAGRETTIRGTVLTVKSCVRHRFSWVARSPFIELIISLPQLQDALRRLYPDANQSPPVRVDGLRPNEPVWACLDGGPIVLHVMTPRARLTWRVEEHWEKNLASKRLDLADDDRPGLVGRAV